MIDFQSEPAFDGCCMAGDSATGLNRPLIRDATVCLVLDPTGPWRPNHDAAVQPVEADICGCHSISSRVASVWQRSRSLELAKGPLIRWSISIAFAK